MPLGSNGQVKQGFWLAGGFFAFALFLGLLMMILGKVSK
jgi:hypothetical protein